MEQVFYIPAITHHHCLVQTIPAELHEDRRQQGKPSHWFASRTLLLHLSQRLWSWDSLGTANPSLEAHPSSLCALYLVRMG